MSTTEARESPVLAKLKAAVRELKYHDDLLKAHASINEKVTNILQDLVTDEICLMGKEKDAEGDVGQESKTEPAYDGPSIPFLSGFVPLHRPLARTPGPAKRTVAMRKQRSPIIIPSRTPSPSSPPLSPARPSSPPHFSDSRVRFTSPGPITGRDCFAPVQDMTYAYFVIFHGVNKGYYRDGPTAARMKLAATAAGVCWRGYQSHADATAAWREALDTCLHLELNKELPPGHQWVVFSGIRPGVYQTKQAAFSAIGPAGGHIDTCESVDEANAQFTAAVMAGDVRFLRPLIM